MSRQRLPLEIAELIARSREIAGVDLDDDAIGEPLQVLHRALNEEARLDAAGAQAFADKLLRLMVNRLRMKRDFARHPEIAREVIHGPLVIMGVARSGTTKLQKLLAASGDFNFLTLWQNLAWASVSGKPGEPVAGRIAAADAFCRWFDERSPQTKLGHRFCAEEPEEEGPLSEGCLVAPSFIGYAEIPSYARWLAGQPRRILFEFIRDVLKYQQWQGLAGAARPWLLKSPNYNGHEATIRAVFPDARFVVAHRSPLSTLASMSKLVGCFRQAYGDPQVDPAPIIEGNYLGMAAHLANRELYPDIAFLDLRFADIVASPGEVIERIYAHAAMPLTERARAAMLEWNAANSMHKHGDFAYSLTDAGLDEASVRCRMTAYFELLERLDQEAAFELVRS